MTFSSVSVSASPTRRMWEGGGGGRDIDASLRVSELGLHYAVKVVLKPLSITIPLKFDIWIKFL